MDNLTVGCIIAWTREEIPPGWHICDGTGGTVNLVDKFIKGASIDGDVGNTGGAQTHVNSYPATSLGGSHNHQFTATLAAETTAQTSDYNVQNLGGTIYPFAASGHSHTKYIILDTLAGHDHATPSNQPATNIPKHIVLVFIQKIV